MEKKCFYVSRYFGYNPKKRFCVLRDKVSRTIQDAIVDVPSLLKAFDGHLDDLFNKYNNGLLYESQTGVGVFVDELNADEVKRYNEFIENQKKREADAENERKLFEQFKNDIASGVYLRRDSSNAPLDNVNKTGSEADIKLIV